jgi:rfaE bifunctional protein nucleotidyltransferase chain/domain/rfaE bifunctional protein kinase chain/domain
VVVGDALLDRDLVGGSTRLCPEAPVPVVDVAADRTRPGGAALAAVLAAADGRATVLVTALGEDGAGAEVRRLLAAAGVELVDLGLTGQTPEKTRVLADGHLLVRVDRGDDGSAVGPWTAAAEGALAGATAVLVADYGRGMAAADGARTALGGLPARTPLVWDPHPRGPEPVAGARLVTPNRKEAAAAARGVAGQGLAADGARAGALAHRWHAAAVAVTRGSEGVVLWAGEGPALAVPAPPAAGDPCGAGDRFASCAAGLLGDGALPSEAVTCAVAEASAFVAAGGAGAVEVGRQPGATAVPHPRVPAEGDAVALARRVRAGGGTVVATGGCFDLVHAGHVRTLEAARALGDCLVVCLNSDRSVRRLKGEGRPLVHQADRAAVLLGLACVDAVVTFDEDTPARVLERLRPHLFVKGGDYGVGDLPEAGVLATWGGRAVVVPYLEGRSTSSMVEAVGRGAGRG